MKKITIYLGLLIIAILVLSRNISLDNKKTPKFEETSNKTSTINLKMAHNLPENSALHEASVLYSKKIDELTNGKIKINIYPKQELGNDHKMVELARNGELDILLTPTAKMSVVVPSMQYADLPFLFPTREDAYALLDGKVGEMILKDLDDIDLLGVTFWENGFKHFTGNKPLLNPSDFKDEKIRIMKSRIIEEQFIALEAQPIPIDFHSTKKALKDKVVDGQENPLVAIVNMGFHEVQSDLTISGHAYLPYVFSISKKSLSKLSIDEQEILISTGRSITPWEREETQKREKNFLDVIKKSGTNIHKLNAEQKRNFANKTNYITKLYEDIIGSDIISKTEEFLYNKYQKDTVIAIGVNVNLSSKTKGSGLAIKRGVELAVDEINKNGGLLGKKVVVLAKSHDAVSTQGIANIKAFASDYNVLGIIGGKYSAIVSSELEYIQKAKIPYISPWAAASKIIENGYEDNYVFRVSANDNFLVKKLWSEVSKTSKKPLLIVENSIWGRGGLDIINKQALLDGFGNISSFIVNRGETKFSEIIQKIKNEKNDSILMIINSNEGTNLVNELGKNGIKTPIVSHWGIVGDQFYKKNKDILKELDLRFVQSFSFTDSKEKDAQNIALAYVKKYGVSSREKINAPSGVAQAYDATRLLAFAIKQANSTDRTKIKEELENIEYFDGLLKEYKKPFTKKDHEALDEKDFFFSKYDDNGNIVLIK